MKAHKYAITIIFRMSKAKLYDWTMGTIPLCEVIRCHEKTWTEELKLERGKDFKFIVKQEEELC